MKSLKNHILISMPHMRDPFFERAVVYICDHNKNGAMGFVINKHFDQNDKKFLQTLFIDEINLLDFVPTVYFGGPVLVERGTILHTSDYFTKETIIISNEFSMTANKKILTDIKNGLGPKQFRLMLGYAGWSEGQLEKEIENGDWLMQSTNVDFIFQSPDELKWKKAAESLGIETSQISGQGGVA